MIWISTFALAWLAVAALMILLWLINLFKYDPDRIDLFWGIGPLIAGIIFLCHEDITPPRLYVLSLLGFWAGRLSAYLWLVAPLRLRPERLKQSLAQKRYRHIRLFGIYQLQGLRMTLVAIPCLWMGRQTMEMGGGQFALGTFILFMIILQSIADTQLYEHLSRKTETLYQSNVWYHSRHPNYFFEGMVWLGFAMMACTISGGWLSLLSPFVYVLCALFVWIPCIERNLVIHFPDAYPQYQQHTGKFWFRFRKIAP